MKQLFDKLTKTHFIILSGFLFGFLIMTKCSNGRTQKYNRLQIESMEKSIDSINLVFKDSIKTLNFKLKKAEEDKMNLFNQLDQCYETQQQIFESNKGNKELKKSIDLLKKEIEK